MQGPSIWGNIFSITPTNPQLVYAPSPGANNLVSSVATQTISDIYNNAIWAGDSVYWFEVGIGYFSYTVGIDGNITWRFNPTNQQIGGYNIVDQLGIYQVSAGVFGLSFSNTPHMIGPGIFDGPLVAPVNFPAIADPGAPPNGSTVWASGGHSLRIDMASGINTRISLSNAGASNVNTVTTATFANLSFFSYLGSSGSASGEFRFHVSGYGTWGSTAQDLFFQPFMGSGVTALVGTAVDIAAATFPISTPFFWDIQIRYIIVAGGAGATWRCIMTGTVGQTAAAITPSSGVVSFCMDNGGTDISLDATAAQQLGLAAKWASTVGAPTISKYWSEMEFLGF